MPLYYQCAGESLNHKFLHHWRKLQEWGKENDFIKLSRNPNVTFNKILFGPTFVSKSHPGSFIPGMQVPRSCVTWEPRSCRASLLSLSCLLSLSAFRNGVFHFSIMLIIFCYFCNFAISVMCQEFQDGQGENEKIAKLETWSFRRCNFKSVSSSSVLKGKLKETGKRCLEKVVLYCAMGCSWTLFLSQESQNVGTAEGKAKNTFGVCCCVCSVSRAHLMLLY